MHKIILSFFLVFTSQLSFADSVFLKCSGVQLVLIGENIYAPKSQSDAIDFEIGVDTKTPQLFGFPTRIAPGCFEKKWVENQVEETKFQCSISSIEVSCSCDNLMSTSHLRLSRRTGSLEITSTYKKSNSTHAGKFSCVKSNAKIF